MFERIERVPGDAILGLIEAYQQDTNPQKVDLGVGVYRDDKGRTPVLATVKKAEEQLYQQEATKSYIGSHGDTRYTEAVTKMVVGEDSKALSAGRISTTQTPGGTGALRLAADFLKSHLSNRAIWLSDPTWPNHPAIFEAAGIEVKRYPYVNADNRLDFEAMLAALEEVPEGDIVLLHACCHNPTGFDLSEDQWREILEVVKSRGLLPLIDFAYQGFGDGLDQDAFGVRLFVEALDELLITTSCSKNFGLYRERTGSLMVLAADHEQMQNVRTQIAIAARENYSTPPSHGAAVVAEILGSQTLTEQWQQELAEMRGRINGLRSDFVAAFRPHGLEERFAFIAEQRGMFSYTGLTQAQVKRLRDEFSIYMVGSGRANIAGLSGDSLEYVARAIATVVK
ncbi:aromatic amino acid transaminase [Kushneria indalinina]|uniref:Aromatic amino acid aminotransferase n=1 Tax=Kushneria indalinina DSM 14324 TaxID=1122140 RepID=A0A3D9DYV9_9GAMM|nr:amino acid aminotransferase [Kushneria indalinina]REC95976.1 aromatic amino acid aminotransferase [Kushneria indalinina DSM 14324]